MIRNKMTLLEVVQSTLDAMNYNPVNSISDLPESLQIAEEARVVYYDLMDRDDWAHLNKLIPLESVSDVTRPNFLKIPTNVARIYNLKYETTKDDDDYRSFEVITYCPPKEFLDRVHARRTDDTDVITVLNHDSVPMFILDDEAPTYWTSFDDEYIIFDSYDSAVDTTMQSSKSLVEAKVIPEWTSSDTFIPDMPEQMFSVFLAEVRAASFTYWKQGQSPKDEQRAARGIARLRKDARKIDEDDGKVKHGRRRPGHYVSEDGDKGSARRTSW